jgi:GNAT superfamily N-acetyltransferase/RimJ/RimL family protein N-acetyltransferase
VDISWLDPADPQRTHLDGVVALLEACRVTDFPHDPLPRTVPVLRAAIRHGWNGTPTYTAAATDGLRVIGVLELEMPEWDNTHSGYAEINVDPLLRRRGIGQALFEAAVARLLADGRTLLMGAGWDSPASTGFAKAMGLDRASEEINRLQDVAGADPAVIDALFAGAEVKAAAYELVPIIGSAPEELLEPLAELSATINDAPTDDLEIEDEQFTPERLRAGEAAQVSAGRRQYRLVARERATGVLAGHTVVAIDADHPWHGWQYDTSVAAAHRGHRLGLLVKTGMLRLLREHEPQLRALSTWNAASNDHMIAVNDQLGYRVIGTATAWQKHLDR